MKYGFFAREADGRLRSFLQRKGKQMAKQTHDIVMTIDDLAKYLKLSTSTLYKLCAEGKVPGQKVGRHWRFHKAVVDQWLTEGLKRQPRK